MKLAKLIYILLFIHIILYYSCGQKEDSYNQIIEDEQILSTVEKPHALLDRNLVLIIENNYSLPTIRDLNEQLEYTFFYDAMLGYQFLIYRDGSSWPEVDERRLQQGISQLLNEMGEFILRTTRFTDVRYRTFRAGPAMVFGGGYINSTAVLFRHYVNPNVSFHLVPNSTSFSLSFIPDSPFLRNYSINLLESVALARNQPNGWWNSYRRSFHDFIFHLAWLDSTFSQVLFNSLQINDPLNIQYKVMIIPHGALVRYVDAYNRVRENVSYIMSYNFIEFRDDWNVMQYDQNDGSRPIIALIKWDHR
ncbi:MAG: hypothetical protein FWE37_00675 [Spirochaetaceae bacterium]|nr:hypothetical protein [Spirochaetaceae bacterium]